MDIANKLSFRTDIYEQWAIGIGFYYSKRAHVHTYSGKGPFLQSRNRMDAFSTDAFRPLGAQIGIKDTVQGDIYVMINDDK